MKDWRDKFESEFGERTLVNAPREDIEDFIDKLIQNFIHKDELRGVLEELKKKLWANPKFTYGYNQAIKDLKTKLLGEEQA